MGNLGLKSTLKASGTSAKTQAHLGVRRVRMNQRPKRMIIVITVAVVAAVNVQAQTFNLLHSFVGGNHKQD